MSDFPHLLVLSADAERVDMAPLLRDTNDTRDLRDSALPPSMKSLELLRDTNDKRDLRELRGLPASMESLKRADGDAVDECGLRGRSGAYSKRCRASVVACVA